MAEWSCNKCKHKEEFSTCAVCYRGSRYEEQPTVTEAEIRNKAIDEFAEKIKEWQKEVYANDRYVGELDFLFKHIYEIAEQLKGE